MILTLLGSVAVAVLLAASGWAGRRIGRRRWPGTSGMVAGAMLLLALPPAGLAAYLGVRLIAGPPAEASDALGDGIAYRRVVRTGAYRSVLHVVEVDRPVARQWRVTPPVATTDGPRNRAATITAAAGALNARLTINANFFRPFRDNWVFDAYPADGDVIEPVGAVVSDGVRYGMPKPGWPSFWQVGDAVGLGETPPDAAQAITGRQWLMRDGVVVAGDGEPAYPRTAIALNAARSRAWLIVVDGKQPRYSDGMTLVDLAAFLASLGAADTIELDGGGSSAMAWHDAGGTPRLLTRPCHTKVPGRERPCGVYLGLR